MFTIKQNDTSPSYLVDLSENVGQQDEGLIDLTNATGVSFIMRQQGETGAPEVKAAMSIVGSPANGRVQYDWDVGDTAVAGDYDVEFEITWTGGAVETVPNDSYLHIQIIDDLDA